MVTVVKKRNYTSWQGHIFNVSMLARRLWHLAQGNNVPEYSVTEWLAWL